MPPSWLSDVVAQAHGRLIALPDAHPARVYLTQRGVTPREILTYHIGYTGSDWQLPACTEDFWKWARRYWYERIVFPMTDPFGAPIGLQVRHLGDKGYENYTLKPRELYPPCFGLHVALPAMFQSQRVVLVEGIFDYFAAVKVAPDAFAALTANVSQVTKRLIARYCTMAIALFDMDPTGRRGAYRLAGLEVPPQWRKPDDVNLKTPPVPPYQVLIPSYSAHDPADLLARGGPGLVELQRCTSPHVLSAPSSISLPANVS